jgi:ubiquinone/menaquinone biosynthesis C-methylase UbiE
MDPRTMWGSGNYAAVADKISAVGEHIVEAVGLAPGMDVLDVACGSGNATIPAARAGARVTGVDFSPELLAIARERAADAMVEIDWVDGDAEQLPFADASFDRVISTFGHMFASDHERSAAELRRVRRRDGLIGICCWTPEGAIGRMFAMVAELVPPPPGAASPLLWGTEEHVRKLLGDDARFERREVEWRDPSTQSYADFMLESFGPLLNARELLGERAPELRSAYISFLEGENLESDGSLRFRGEYLAAVIKP